MGRGRKRTTTKLTAEQVAERREQVMALRHECYTMPRIAKTLSLTEKVVRGDIEHCIGEAQKREAAYSSGILTEHLLANEYLENVAWQDYRRSLQKFTRKTVKRTSDGDEITLVEEDRIGSASHLELIRRCRQDRARLLGLIDSEGRLTELGQTSSGGPMQQMGRLLDSILVQAGLKPPSDAVVYVEAQPKLEGPT